MNDEQLYSNNEVINTVRVDFGSGGPKKSKALSIILKIIGVLLVIGIIVCGVMYLPKFIGSKLKPKVDTTFEYDYNDNTYRNAKSLMQQQFYDESCALIDSMIVTQLYEVDEDERRYVDENNNTLKTRTSEQDYLDAIKMAAKANNETEFKAYLSVKYRIENKLVIDYAKEQVTEAEANDFYNNEYTAGVRCLGVEYRYSTDGWESSYYEPDEATAKSKAQAFISKIGGDISFEDAMDDEDAYSSIYGYGFFDNFNDYDYYPRELFKALSKIKTGSYNQEPIHANGSYGTASYYVIQKEDEKTKPAFEEVKDQIYEILAKYKIQEFDDSRENWDDDYYQDVACAAMREKFVMESGDKEFIQVYEQYKKDIENDKRIKERMGF